VDVPQLTTLPVVLLMLTVAQEGVQATVRAVNVALEGVQATVVAVGETRRGGEAKERLARL
jgi:hypothetical protein